MAVRETAVWAIGEQPDAGAASDLGALVANDRSSRVRCTAAWALGQLGGRTAPRGLITALENEDTELRLTAAWALSEIGDQAALPALRSALSRERDERTRQAMLRGLIHCGEASERMTELLQSKDAEVRKAAIRAATQGNGPDPWPWPQPRPRPFP